MARKISVEIVGDSASLQRAFQRSASGARTFDRDLGRTARGAVAASLSFRGLGRAAAYASGYLIGGASLAYGLKAVTKAATEHQAAEAQLAAAVRHAGVSYRDYGGAIEETLKKQRDLSGFSENDTFAAFTKLLRTTKSVTAATHDSALAMEIARGANISLEAASNVVNKTLAGQTTGLRRLGVELPKGVSGYRALEIAGAKYAGSITAYSHTAAGAQARLTNAIHESEVTIGTALLPTITNLSTRLADWLNKSKNQERIQRDVNEVLRDAKTITHDFGVVVHDADLLTGSFKHTVELLLALKVVKTLKAWRIATLLFGASAGEAGAAGSVGSLITALRRLEAIGAVSVAIRFPGLAAGLAGLASVPAAIAAIATGGVLASSGSAPNVSGFSADKKTQAVVQLGTSGKIPSVVITSLAKGLGLDPSQPAGNLFKNKELVNELFAWAVQHGLIGSSAGGADAAAKAAAGKGRVPAPGATGVSSSGSATAGLDRLSQIQNAVAQARLAVAKKTPGAQQQLVAALKAQIDFDRKYEKIQAALVAKGGKDAKAHAKTLQALYADETSALDEINSTQDKALSAEDRAAKKAAELARKRRDAARKAAAKAAQEAQTFTVPIALQIAAARAATTVGTSDDTKVARQIEAFARKMIASGKKKGQALVDAWNEIAAQMNVIGQANTSQVHAVAASAENLTRGIKFSSVAARKAQEARIAQALAHNGHVPTGHAVAGQTVDVTVPIYLDGREIARSVTRHQQRDGSHAPVQTRGPHAGRNPRVH